MANTNLEQEYLKFTQEMESFPELKEIWTNMITPKSEGGRGDNPLDAWKKMRSIKEGILKSNRPQPQSPYEQGLAAGGGGPGGGQVADPIVDMAAQAALQHQIQKEQLRDFGQPTQIEEFDSDMFNSLMGRYPEADPIQLRQAAMVKRNVNPSVLKFMGFGIPRQAAESLAMQEAGLLPQRDEAGRLHDYAAALGIVDKGDGNYEDLKAPTMGRNNYGDGYPDDAGKQATAQLDKGLPLDEHFFEGLKASPASLDLSGVPAQVEGIPTRATEIRKEPIPGDFGARVRQYERIKEQIKVEEAKKAVEAATPTLQQYLRDRYQGGLAKTSESRKMTPKERASANEQLSSQATQLPRDAETIKNTLTDWKKSNPSAKLYDFKPLDMEHQVQSLLETTEWGEFADTIEELKYSLLSTPGIPLHPYEKEKRIFNINQSISQLIESLAEKFEPSVIKDALENPNIWKELGGPLFSNKSKYVRKNFTSSIPKMVEDAFTAHYFPLDAVSQARDDIIKAMKKGDKTEVERLFKDNAQHYNAEATKNIQDFLAK